MSDVKQCDRCGVLVKEDYGMPRLIRSWTFKLMKIRTTTFDFCPDCTIKFKKFMGIKEKK